MAIKGNDYIKIVVFVGVPGKIGGVAYEKDVSA